MKFLKLFKEELLKKETWLEPTWCYVISGFSTIICLILKDNDNLYLRFFLIGWLIFTTTMTVLSIQYNRTEKIK